MPCNLAAYARKTDAELNYIIRDAGAAAIAMRTHGTLQGNAAEAKYLDQVNDACTILGRRAVQKVTYLEVDEWERLAANLHARAERAAAARTGAR